ncbi:MAG: hypothetical protein A3F15_00405 [Candidatus Wildermuthbacteria bacterium RIFCSPHIGHO2_12_FULL_40_12]|uniref:GlcNAc-PI de-N-acetylase n=1 Tax=Candidatus Wildermuthbacteria bacterium RIFCSPHIGHO2_12_FULL_40_12 TaxID=1802457 RepID=A0A1G2RBT0_9BACT|nr:MAG: hypothetical protein A3F15_00405 [Candidatus Wildermuthbacteria bacterium RIFCSPHIGHO2_12_FULL_40_12]
MDLVEMDRVLVFAPHPDDETIGCGGSIVKHLELEREVSVAFPGNTTDITCRHMTHEEYLKLREGEIPRALKVLGIDPDHTIMGSENNPWHYSEERLRLWALAVIRKIEPQVVYLPHPNDDHVDHKVVSRAVLDAIGMAPGPWFLEYGSESNCPPVQTVLGYEVWTPIQSPTYYETLTVQQTDTAMRALCEYTSQEIHKYEQACRARYALRASMHEGPTGKFAEAFTVLKATNLF